MTKILLVEDDKSLREIYGVRLVAEGYDIVSAGDGEEALAMAIKEKPILIISDVMMPKISGFDMLDILRSTTETREIKVIMMTALSSEDQRARGEQLGADRYLVKSQVGIEDVVRTVHEVLGDGAGGATTPPATVATPTTPDPAATPAPADDTASDAPLAAVAPGNTGAGPLPPQPTELKAPEPVIEPVVPLAVPSVESTSTLPQPTAPFASPRPANLGEQAVHPDTDATATPLSSEPATESTVTPLEPAASEPIVTPDAPGGLVIEPLSPTEPIPIADIPPISPVEPAMPEAPAEDKESTPPATV